MSNAALSDKLKQGLDAEHIEIIDNSWMHAGHVAMADTPVSEGTHLQIAVVSAQFEGISLLSRHRMVHQLLKSDFAGLLHALELKTYTPTEWTAQINNGDPE
jgi:stress-induced morphogen